MNFACVEGIGEDAADGGEVPGAATRGWDLAGFEVGFEVADAFAAEEEVFDLDEVFGEGGDRLWDDFAVVGFAWRAAIAKWDGDRQPVDEDAVSHSAAIFATHAGDLGFGADGADADHEFVCVVFVGVVLVRRDGGVLGGHAEELDAVVAEGGVDEGEEVTQAVVIVDDEDVVLAGAGGFEHFADGGDFVFGIAEVEVLGAALAVDDVGACGFEPAACTHAAADLDLVFEGGAFGLGFG